MMEYLKLAGIVLGTPLAMAGFTIAVWLPLDVASTVLAHSHLLVIVW